MTRIRDLGVRLEGTPGPFNAITDVPGVEVGHCTIIEGDSVRTGVTAIHPRGKGNNTPVFAGWFSLNGNGEMTGTAWIEESGLLNGPVVTTNTHSVGAVHETVVRWMLEHGLQTWALPVVAETYDGYLNDINRFSVTRDHVFQALETAASGPVAEGNVGGGTGMICYGYKGGIGTSSRRIGDFTVGTLVQANHGKRSELRIGGAPVGDLDQLPDRGSIITVIATDAPMLPHQLKAVAKRGALGLARTGSVAAITSGDLFVAFSNGNALSRSLDETFAVTALGLEQCTPIYGGAVQATEEAILNALAAAQTMTGFRGHTVHAISHEVVQRAGRKGKE